MPIKQNRLDRALQVTSANKSAADEIREATIETLSDWGTPIYQWVYDLLPLKCDVDPLARTKLRKILKGLESYEPNSQKPYPIKDLKNIEIIGAMCLI